MKRAIRPEPATPPPTVSADERHVVCVIEDGELRRALQRFLPVGIHRRSEDISYRFAFLRDPFEALEAIRRAAAGGSLAMILSEQTLSGMRGTELLKHARDDAEDSICLLLTGYAGIDAAVAAMNERVLDRYLPLPIESEESFAESLHTLLQKYELRRTVRDQGRRIHELYEFASALNAKETLPATLQSVATFSARILGCRHVAVIGGSEGEEQVAVVGESEGAVRIVARGRRRQALERLAEVRVGCVESTDRMPILESAGGAPAGGILYGVLEAESHRFGVIIATGPARGAFGADEKDIMAYVASTASVAVHNQVNRARLHEAWAEARSHAASLVEANARLRILDQLKSDFLGFISHELRTPLSLLSAIEMIGDADAADAKEMARIIQSGYGRLQGFINNGLEYMGWLAAGRDCATEDTDLGRVVRDLAAEWNPGGSAMDLALEVAGEAWVRMNHAPAHEVVRILLDNAVKFSSGRPRVRIHVEAVPSEDPERVRLVVQDEGRGFPPGWSNELFQPFTVVETMRHREGTALSLAKVAAILQAHGGEIRAHSAGLGHGSTFTVELPLSDGDEGVLAA